MRTKYATFVIASVICVSSLPGLARASSPAVTQGSIKFTVGVSGSSKPLAGAEVVLLSSKSGETVLGKTDELGTISVSTSTIRKSKARAVLFCAKYFFCGAVRVTPDLFEYSEKYIELAPFAVR